MEEMEVVKDRTVGSRFALSYNQHTTKNCLGMQVRGNSSKVN